MRRKGGTFLPWAPILLLASQAGCTALAPSGPASATPPAPGAVPAAVVEPESRAVRQAASQEQAPGGRPKAAAEDAPAVPDIPPHVPKPTPSAVTAPPPSEAPFAGRRELAVDPLVREVLARNPTLTQMVAAWEAARARYPQVTSLDDPMLGTTLAPAGIGTIQNRNRGYRLDISQRFPWCGKLALRGENAKAQARAAANDIDDARLQLVEAAKIAFYDYYLVYRALEVNAENLKLLRELKQNAEARYKFGTRQERAPQQDILQANVEIGRQRRRNLTLERMRQVAVARLNTLLNLDPDTPLPPPPKKVEVEDGLPEASALRASALARRPDLRALANRIAADEASLGLAYKDYYPDFNLTAAYDTFWVERQLQPQIAVQMNLPVRLARRDAAVWEAKSRLAERRAELARQVNQVNYEVNQAYAEVNESKQAARLYEQKVVPDAELNVKSAQAAYLTGTIPFLTLVEAERNVIGFKNEYYEFVADYYRRLATLERVAGGSLVPGAGGPSPAQPALPPGITGPMD